MKKSAALFAIISLFLVSWVIAGEKKAPDTLVFQSKPGAVTFTHLKHSERDKCEVCHDKVFAKDAKAPLNYKAMMHKKAESEKSSCATCHVTGGKAFASKANCAKCHKK